MTDKKIKSLIEIRWKDWKYGSSTEAKYKAEECKDILELIDSLQEEPVRSNIDFEQELYKAFGQVKDFTLGMQIAKRFYDMGKNNGKEPVSDDLEEAAEKYAQEAYSHPVDRNVGKADFIAGAKWQKQQDQETIELAEDHAMLAGMEKMKEQMMAKAVDAKLLEGHLIRQKGVTHPLHVGDKVKVIVINEE